MAPNAETKTAMGNTSKRSDTTRKPPGRLSMENLQRTMSDISLELSKEDINNHYHQAKLPAISEAIEDAKCECCGMCEECTPEYINRVRAKFSGKLICGLCSEAVNEEIEKNGGKCTEEEALNRHMSFCVRFNKFGRTNPVLYQVEAMREILRKSSTKARAKSMSPRDYNKINSSGKAGGILRSSSCIPAITRETSDGRGNG